MLIAGESGSDPIVAVIGVIVDSSGIHETQLTPVSWLLNRVEGSEDLVIKNRIHAISIPLTAWGDRVSKVTVACKSTVYQD